MQIPESSLTFFIAITTLLILLLCGFLVVFVFLYRKRQLAQDKKIKDLKTSFQENLLESRIEMQEETFQHISREIHDNIGLSLSLVKLYMSLFELPKTPEQEQFYQTAREQLDHAILNLKDLSHSMNSGIIKEIGLVKSIEQELARLRKTNQFKTTVEIIGIPEKMELEREIIVFRMVQESLSNIMNHAKATKVITHLEFREHELAIRIEDDGQGFSAEELWTNRQEKSSSGLLNMKNRSELLKGNFSIDSSPGKGTIINFLIPYK